MSMTIVCREAGNALTVAGAPLSSAAVMCARRGAAVHFLLPPEPSRVVVVTEHRRDGSSYDHHIVR